MKEYVTGADGVEYLKLFRKEDLSGIDNVPAVENGLFCVMRAPGASDYKRLVIRILTEGVSQEELASEVGHTTAGSMVAIKALMVNKWYNPHLNTECTLEDARDLLYDVTFHCADALDRFQKGCHDKRGITQ